MPNSVELAFAVALSGGTLLGKPILLPALLVLLLWLVSEATPYVALVCLCAAAISIVIREKRKDARTRILWVSSVFVVYYLMLYGIQADPTPQMCMQVVLYVTAMYLAQFFIGVGSK